MRPHTKNCELYCYLIFALFLLLGIVAIRNAVNSFRVTLVKSVREDVKRLQDKFRLR